MGTFAATLASALQMSPTLAEVWREQTLPGGPRCPGRATTSCSSDFFLLAIVPQCPRLQAEPASPGQPSSWYIDNNHTRFHHRNEDLRPRPWGPLGRHGRGPQPYEDTLGVLGRAEARGLPVAPIQEGHVSGTQRGSPLADDRLTHGSTRGDDRFRRYAARRASRRRVAVHRGNSNGCGWVRSRSW